MLKKSLYVVAFLVAPYLFNGSSALAQTIPQPDGITWIGKVDSHILAITLAGGGCYYTVIQAGSALTANRSITGTSGNDHIIVLSSSTYVPCFGATMDPLVTGSFTFTVNAGSGNDRLESGTTPNLRMNGGDGPDNFCGNGAGSSQYNGGLGVDNRCGTGGTNNSILTFNCPC